MCQNRLFTVHRKFVLKKDYYKELGLWGSLSVISTCSEFLSLVCKMKPTLCFCLIYVSQCNVFKCVSQPKEDRAVKKLLTNSLLDHLTFFGGWGWVGGGHIVKCLLPVRNEQRCCSAAEWLQEALQKSCKRARCSSRKFWLQWTAL